MSRFSYIFYKLASGPARWPGLFYVACLAAGSFLCVHYLREHALTETVALALLGAVIAVPIAMLCVVLSQKTTAHAIDEELRREMEKARNAREERDQQNLTRFLEDCIEEEGDTPVWKSDK